MYSFISIESHEHHEPSRAGHFSARRSRAERRVCSLNCSQCSARSPRSLVPLCSLPTLYPLSEPEADDEQEMKKILEIAKMYWNGVAERSPILIRESMDIELWKVIDHAERNRMPWIVVHTPRNVAKIRNIIGNTIENAENMIADRLKKSTLKPRKHAHRTAQGNRVRREKQNAVDSSSHAKKAR